jgi:hypothetical protein
LGTFPFVVAHCHPSQPAAVAGPSSASDLINLPYPNNASTDCVCLPSTPHLYIGPTLLTWLLTTLPYPIIQYIIVIMGTTDAGASARGASKSPKKSTKSPPRKGMPAIPLGRPSLPSLSSVTLHHHHHHRSSPLLSLDVSHKPLRRHCLPLPVASSLLTRRP